MRIRPRRRPKPQVDQPESAAELPAGDAESEPSVIAREMAESLTNELHDSDTASEVLHDSQEDSTRPGRRRLLMGVAALLLTASGVLARRRRRRG